MAPVVKDVDRKEERNSGSWGTILGVAALTAVAGAAVYFLTSEDSPESSPEPPAAPAPQLNKEPQIDIKIVNSPEPTTTPAPQLNDGSQINVPIINSSITLPSAKTDVPQSAPELQAAIQNAQLTLKAISTLALLTGKDELSGLPEAQTTPDGWQDDPPPPYYSNDPTVMIQNSAIKVVDQRTPAFDKLAQDAKSAPEPTSAPPTPVDAYGDLYCSWFRVMATTEDAFPDASLTGPAPFRDLDGSPIFIGSAILERSVEPCKIGPGVRPSWVSVCYNGTEHFHSGRYDILAEEDQQQMEWVPAARGRIPPGRRPVLGGYDEEYKQLYHALGVVDGIEVPGKTAPQLGARLSFNGQEHKISEGYSLLCWKH